LLGNSRAFIVFPLGSTAQVIALDENKHYAGVVSVAEAHTLDLNETIAVADILHFADTVLLPTMTLKEVGTLFDRAEAEALAVIEALDNREVIGLLTEAYALRRYTDELEQRRQDLLGE
jgi:CIC family chloride channel protein